ncbi:MAG: VOC family protein [Polyangiales bacterium]
MNAPPSAAPPLRCVVPRADPSPLAKATSLVSVILARPDLPSALAFFRDFGLAEHSVAADAAFLRGVRSEAPCVELVRGPARYVGLRFAVGSRAELERLAEAAGSSLEAGDEALGGERVRLEDPDGMVVEVVHGTRPLPPLVPAARPGTNGPEAQPRVNATVRLAHAPPAVAKLGHTVLGVRRFEETVRWYQRHLGLIVSDAQLLPDDPVPVVAFLRCDRGPIPTDHHTLAIGSAIDLGHLHTAFELDGVEDVVRAHALLRERGFKHTWGIGRHILGSQVFDYWRDPYGDLFEHYADGDRFDASVPTGYHAFGGDSLHQWGPAPTADMVGKIPTLHRAATLARRLSSDDDLTPSRLKRLLAAAG